MLVGVVVIGRNEGERLRRCLDSVAAQADAVVYVDSGTSDGSIVTARQFGADVVELDLSQPFTAARARNVGFQRLYGNGPAIPLVQFVDGDCEVAPGWLRAACTLFEGRPEVGVVCGRLRERFPDRSIYNRLCDMEWDTPVGEALACGGIAMMRSAALVQAGGFRADLIAGEEPELCVRLRRLGWRIWRLDAEMALHDAAMTRFSQWWRRAMRAGFAFAEGSRLHGAAPERHWVRETRSAQVWGLGIPVLVLAACLVFGPIAALAFLIYPLQIVRLSARRDGPLAERALWAAFIVLAKCAEAAGQLMFFVSRLTGRRTRLIEYK